MNRRFSSAILMMILLLGITGCGRISSADVQIPDTAEVTGEDVKWAANSYSSDSEEWNGSDLVDTYEQECADDKEKADDKTTESEALIKADLMELKRSYFQFDDSLLDIYTGILLSKVSFNDETGYTESQNAYLNELNIEGIPMQYHQFSLVDFNQDQVPELVLKATRGEGAEMVLVFHIQEGEAYCHWYSNRELQEIKADGTYLGSGGAGTFYICREEFDKTNSTTQYLASQEMMGMDENDQPKISYYINGEKVGEEAFSSYMKDYENKEDAAWCEFPDEIQNNN